MVGFEWNLSCGVAPTLLLQLTGYHFAVALTIAVGKRKQNVHLVTNNLFGATYVPLMHYPSFPYC